MIGVPCPCRRWALGGLRAKEDPDQGRDQTGDNTDERRLWQRLYVDDRGDERPGEEAAHPHHAAALPRAYSRPLASDSVATSPDKRFDWSELEGYP